MNAQLLFELIGALVIVLTVGLLGVLLFLARLTASAATFAAFGVVGGLAIGILPRVREVDAGTIQIRTVMQQLDSLQRQYASLDKSVRSLRTETAGYEFSPISPGAGEAVAYIPRNGAKFPHVAGIQSITVRSAPNLASPMMIIGPVKPAVMQ